MEAVFLGTSSMVPTKDRNHSGIFVSMQGCGILLDCGEGTQRQLKVAGIPLTKVNVILITHWHGDHVLGLGGLIQTMGSSDYQGKLRVYGPAGSRKYFSYLKKSLVFEDKVEVEVVDVKKGVFFRGGSFSIDALPLEHSTDCLGYSIVEADKRKMLTDQLRKIGIPDGPLVGRLQAGCAVRWNGRVISPDAVSAVQKGKKLAYVTDTRLCRNAIELARDSDVLICESTYADDLEEKAEKHRHMTARQAALIANKAGARKLVLTHFSQRYKDTRQIGEDAKTVFDNSVCAYDFMRVEV